MSGAIHEDWPGTLVVLSGPSGVGKTALTERLVEVGACVRAVTATTRSPRAGEKDGEDYYFYASREAFLEHERQGRFLEHAEVHGELYGTPLEPIVEQLSRGETVMLNIDVQGAGTLMEKRVAATYVFIEPPSVEELERRLKGRGSDDPESVALRLESAMKELAERGRYQYQVVNDKFETAVEALRSLLESGGKENG